MRIFLGCVVSKKVITCAFGDAGKWVKGLIKNLSCVTDLPLVIYTDEDRYAKFLRKGDCVRVVDTLWKGHPRWGQRNGDYWQFMGAYKEGGLCCYLDWDMRVVNRKFHQGFELAEKFGLCLSVNPRCHYGLDRNVGADVAENIRELENVAEIPYCGSAINCGVMFANTEDSRAGKLLTAIIHFIREFPCRGPVAVNAAAWQTSIFPYLLSEKWCICNGKGGWEVRSGQIIEPVVLHTGHKDIERWYLNEPSFERFR